MLNFLKESGAVVGCIGIALVVILFVVWGLIWIAVALPWPKL